jgi:hypothetical protein
MNMLEEDLFAEEVDSTTMILAMTVGGVTLITLSCIFLSLVAFV